MKPFILSVILAFWLSGFSALVFAQPQQSEHFRISKSVLDAGGGLSTSTNFRLVSAFGQPSPLGMQASNNFLLSGGFLSPMFSVSPLSPIQALVIKPSVPNVILYWPRASGAVSYRVYRSENPLFTPAAGNLLGTATDTTYTDMNVTGLPAVRHYYIVTALNSGGTLLSIPQQPSEISKQAVETAPPLRKDATATTTRTGPEIKR